MTSNYTVKKLNKVFTNEEPAVYQRLVEMYELYQREELCETNLKSLKKLLPSWERINRDLEELVKEGLVERCEGRYRLKVKAVSTSALESLQTQGRKASREILKELSKTLPVITHQPWLLVLAIESLAKRNKETFLLEKNQIGVSEISHAQSDNYLFVDCGKEGETGLAGYFKQSRKTPMRQEALTFIGDVNPNFFLEMTGQVLATLTKEEKLKGIERNIFAKALDHFSYIQLKGKEISEVIVPLVCVSHNELTKDLADVCHKLASQLTEDELLNTLIFNEMLQSVPSNKYVLLLTKD